MEVPSSHDYISQTQSAIIFLLKQTAQFGGVYEDLPEVEEFDKVQGVLFPACFIELTEVDPKRGNRQGLYGVPMGIHGLLLFEPHIRNDYSRRNPSKKDARDKLSFVQRWLWTLDGVRSPFPRLLRNELIDSDPVPIDDDGNEASDLYQIDKFNSLEVIMEQESSIATYDSGINQQTFVMISAPIGIRMQYDADHTSIIRE